MIIPGLFHGCYHYILPPPNARSASSGKSSSCRRHRRHTRTRIRTPETNSGHDCRNAERATVASSKRPRRFREAGRVAQPASRPGQPPFPGANSWCFQGSIRDPRGAPAPARTPGQSPSSQRPQLVRRELRDYERAPQEAPQPASSGARQTPVVPSPRGASPPHPLASQHKQATTQAPALCPSVGMRARVGPRASLHSPAPQSLGTSVRLALKTLRGAGSLATLGLARRLRCTGTPSLSHEPRSAVQHALPSWSEPTPARTGAPPSTQPPARTQAHKLPPDSSASQPALIDDHSQSPCVGSPAAGHPPPRY